MEQQVAARLVRAARNGAGLDDTITFSNSAAHSLLAMRLMSRLNDRVGVWPPLVTIFEQPLLAEFASAHGLADCFKALITRS